VLGIFFGVLLSGKVDSWIHVLGAVTFCGIAVPSVLRLTAREYVTVIVAVVFASFVDEYLHERAPQAASGSALRNVLQYRFGLDVVVLALAMAGWLPFRYCLAMWAFDAAYLAAHFWISFRPASNRPDPERRVSMAQYTRR
jgi:hypothetical protein